MYLCQNYLQRFSGHGRLDRMNCYLWGGSEWGASICAAGLLQHALSSPIIVGRDPQHRSKGAVDKYRSEGAPWLQESDEARRSMGLLEWAQGMMLRLSQRRVRWTSLPAS